MFAVASHSVPSAPRTGLALGAATRSRAAELVAAVVGPAPPATGLPQPAPATRSSTPALRLICLQFTRQPSHLSGARASTGVHARGALFFQPSPCILGAMTHRCASLGLVALLSAGV